VIGAIIVVMQYRYEDLGFTEFQQLVQALLAHALGPAICAMPLGRADGGRDALHATAVFQVKFTKGPGKIEDAVGWLLASLDAEASKIQALVDRGARSYFLITNVEGTGNLDTGTIDRLTQALALREKAWSIRITPWWRDNIDAHMSAAPNGIIRSFLRVLPPDQILALSAMTEQPQGPRTRQMSPIPPRVVGFQARSEKNALDVAFSETKRPQEFFSAVVSGLGGVGKTQLTADYARRAIKQGDLDLLLWISASSRDAIISAYADAEAEIAGSTAADAAESTANRFLARLQATTLSWLIVLDDLASPSDLNGLMPPQRSAGRTIITTRRTDAALLGDGHAMIQVGVFSPAESNAFLQKRLAGHPDLADDLDGVSVDLGRLPLGLSQAAAFMIDRRMSCSEYRHAFAARDRHLAELFPEADALPDQHAHTVAVTWSLSVEAADQLTPVGLALPLLELASVLDSNGIPASVFTTTAACNWIGHARHKRNANRQPSYQIDPEAAYQGLHCLRRLSLLSLENETVRVHRLVQRAARDGLTREQINDHVWAAADAIVEAWPENEADSRLAQIFRANAGILDAHDTEGLWQPERHQIHRRLADSLDESGNLTAAVSAYVRLRDAAPDRWVPGYRDNLHARYNIARLRGKSGEPGRAVEEFEQLLSDEIRLLGRDHPETLTTRASLAVWRGRAGDHTRAAMELEHLVEDATRVLGPEHPSTLRARGNLATLQAKMEKGVKPLADLEQLLAEQTVALEPNHRYTLDLRYVIADLRGERGENQRAIADLKQVILDYERIHGADHPSTLEARRSMAQQMCAVNNVAGAIEEFELLLADQIRILGPQHPEVLASRQSLSSAHSMAGPTPQALAAHQELLRAWSNRDATDPEVLAVRQCLAKVRGETGDPTNARLELEEVLRDIRDVYGPDHPSTLACRTNLAGLRYKAGDLGESIAEFEAVLLDQTRVLGPGNSEIVNTHHNIVSISVTLGEPNRVLRAYEGLVDSLICLKGPDHPDTLHARRQYALWLGRAGRSADAVKELEQLLTECTRALGREHRETLATRHNLANRSSEAGGRPRAVEELKALTAEQERILGPDDRDTLVTRSNLATDVAEHAGPAEAVILCEELHERFTRVFGKDDEDTLVVGVKLATYRAQTGELRRAIEDLEELAPRLCQQLGANHYYSINARGNLAVFRAYTGDVNRAIEELHDVLENQNRILGPQHPDTITTSRNYAKLLEHVGRRKPKGRTER
jgi:hypothetical protein